MQALFSKLKWQCRRGMLELDLILNRFLADSFPKLSSQQVASFEKLLLTPDPLLYHWLIGMDQPEDKEFLELVELIRMQNSFS